MNKEIFSFDVKQAPDSEGVFSGYGAVFGNVDLGRDIILPGAFADSLNAWRAKGKMPRMLWQHSTRTPIGVWTDMQEDNFGLFVRGRLTKGVQVADEALLLMKDGALDGLSIGFDTVDDEYDQNMNVRKVSKVNLWEVSLVSLGMNPEATVTNVKSADEIHTIREFEKFLRDVGYSHAAAKSIAARGFKSLEPRDEDDAMNDLLEEIRQVKSKLVK